MAGDSAAFGEVRLLGPVEIGRPDGTVSTIGSARERTILAALAVKAGLVVDTDALIEAVWGDGAPDGARHALHVHVSALRRILGGSPSPLESRPSGYVLRLTSGQLDSDRFEEASASGRAELASGRSAQAAELLTDALRLWRGPALADVPWDRFASAQVSRLGEARRAAEEDRVDAELAAGRPEIAAELSRAMIEDEPLRERRWCQSMLALYRCGRQADALHAYGRARSILRDDLGVDPGAAMRELQSRILVHDPALASPLPPNVRASAVRPFPATRFARVGECALAYQVLGDGPPDLVFIPGFTGHLEVRWEDPSLSRLFRRLAERVRLILLDKRGTGMSDRTGGFPPLSDHVDDVFAVMDAVGSDQAMLFGVLDGGSIALLAALARPDRVSGVATYATIPAIAAPDYAHAPSPEQVETLSTIVGDMLDVDQVLPVWAPSRVTTGRSRSGSPAT